MGKMNSKNSKCARGSNPESDPQDEDVVITLKGSFLTAITEKKRTLQVWYSNLTSSNDEGVNPPEEQLFQKLPPLSVAVDGTIRLKVRVEELFTITTLQTGGKAKVQSPAKAAFPLSYKQSFDNEKLSAPPKIWYSLMGTWEIQASPYSDGRDQVMRQVVPVWPSCWGYSCAGPTAYFGSGIGSDLHDDGELSVSMDVRLEDHGSITFMTNVNTGGAINTNHAKQWVDLKMNSSDGFATNKWHSLQLRLTNVWQAGAINGVQAFNVSRGKIPADGLSFKVKLDRYIFASIDNFEISNGSDDIILL